MVDSGEVCKFESCCCTKTLVNTQADALVPVVACPHGMSEISTDHHFNTRFRKSSAKNLLMT